MLAGRQVFTNSTGVARWTLLVATAHGVHASNGDRGPARARRPARAPRRLRLARAARPLQGLGPRVRLELREPAPPAHRLLAALRRRPAHAAGHRDGRAALRDLLVRRPSAVDVLRDIPAIRRLGDPRERAAREESAHAAAAPARGERAFGAG